MVDETFTLSGVLTGPEVPTELTIEHPDGTVGTIMTGEDGAYTVDVSSAVGGTRRWKMSYAGDDVWAPVTIHRWVTVAKRPTTLTVDAPTTGVPFRQVPITGRIVGTDGPTQLTLVLRDGWRTTFTTDEDGTFERELSLDYVGLNRFTFIYEGDDRHVATQAEVDIYGQAAEPTLTLRTDRTSYTAGDTARIFIDVANSVSRRVVLRAHTANGHDIVLVDGPLGASGLTVLHRMLETSRLSLSSPSYDWHLPVSTSLPRGVRLRLRTEAKNPVRRSGAYAIYRAGTEPVFRTVSLPARPSACIRHEVQRKRDGVWRNVFTSTCTRQSTSGVARWRLTRSLPVGVPHRVRAVFGGDRMNLASQGSWAFVRFR
jgi:hypothetical protein